MMKKLTALLAALAMQACSHSARTPSSSQWAATHELVCENVTSRALAHHLEVRIPVHVPAGTADRAELAKGEIIVSYKKSAFTFPTAPDEEFDVQLQPPPEARQLNGFELDRNFVLFVDSKTRFEEEEPESEGKVEVREKVPYNFLRLKLSAEAFGTILRQPKLIVRAENLGFRWGDGRRLVNGRGYCHLKPAY